jgi:hypothetical protein
VLPASMNFPIISRCPKSTVLHQSH